MANLDWVVPRIGKLETLTAQYRGPKYLSALVLCLTRLLEVRYAFIAEQLADQPDSARAIVIADAQNLKESFTYKLAGVPCQTVLSGKPVTIDCKINEKFPSVRSIDAYCGHPLMAIDGHALGLIAIEHTSQIAHPHEIALILQFLSGRVAAELECEQLRSQAKR
ncbi:GAF domain-containing protein [Burkholderiaceae bacterium DAT-1]|nr:GAF domain-containing protein [Burkholderiaceae bacterium DAT-1]